MSAQCYSYKELNARDPRFAQSWEWEGRLDCIGLDKLNLNQMNREPANRFIRKILRK